MGGVLPMGLRRERSDIKTSRFRVPTIRANKPGVMGGKGLELSGLCVG